MLYINSAVRTDIGCIRTDNEDNFFLCGRTGTRDDALSCSCELSRPAAGGLFAVCDGMGGLPFGELASRIAVETMALFAAEFHRYFNDYLQTANLLICEKAQSLGERRIGTTLAALSVDGKSRAWVCNVGDSRVYLLRKNRLKLLSVDHTQAQLLTRQGLLSEKEARSHFSRHILTQHLGTPASEMRLDPCIRGPLRLRSGDILLLCSDGLTDTVGDDEISALLCTPGSPGEKADRLVDAALLSGGRDNITVLVAELGGTCSRSSQRQRCTEIQTATLT